MTSATITRIYSSFEQAESVVSALEAASIPSRDITVLSNSKQHASLAPYAGPTRPNPAIQDQIAREETFDTAVTTGGLVGGVGLLTSLGLIALPGLGAVAAAGWLAATLGGFVFGAAAGGAVGAISESLNKHGVDHEQSKRYADAISAGNTLVAVICDTDKVNTVESIMGTSDEVLETSPSTTSRVA